MTVVGLMLGDARSDRNALVVDALLDTILPKRTIRRTYMRGDQLTGSKTKSKLLALSSHSSIRPAIRVLQKHGLPIQYICSLAFKIRLK